MQKVELMKKNIPKTKKIKKDNPIKNENCSSINIATHSPGEAGAVSYTKAARTIQSILLR